MLAIEVEYLTGCAVATDRESRSDAEWPPHPQRLFSALVAACHECNLGSNAVAALEWLQKLNPPSLVVSTASRRICPATYVPVNDNNMQCAVNRKKHTVKFTPGIDQGIALGRDRKERHFPTVIPHDPVVQFVWSDADQDSVKRHRQALEGIVAEVPCLGHSTSLVRVALAESPREPTLSPVDTDAVSTGRNDLHLRGVSDGRLTLLEDVYAQTVRSLRRVEAPDVPRHRYRWNKSVREQASSRNVFGEPRNWFVFQRVGGKRLPLNSCLALTTSVRKAVCSACTDPLPAVLSGHLENGRPLQQSHVAFVPLAHVGHRFADGEIHGFAVVLPDELSLTDRRQIIMALGEVRKVWMNPDHSVGTSGSRLAFDWQVAPVTGEGRLRTLQPARYVRRSRFWTTVTPMVFGHCLRKLDEPRTHRIVAECCNAIGLPRPCGVVVSPTSMVSGGVPQSYAFPSLSTNGKPVWVRYRDGKYLLPRQIPDGSSVRMRYHVALEFDEPVQGPVLIGAGRYFGMGICVPLNEADIQTL